MAAIVGIISRRDLRIEMCHRNQSNNSLPSLYKPLLSLNNYLKQLYIGNKTEHFSYKSRCGMMHIKAFKRRAGLGYRQMVSNIMLFKTVIYH